LLSASKPAVVANIEMERQLMENTSEPIPVLQAQQALCRFKEMLEAASPETQKHHRDLA
jgi:hypothetical protein